MRATPALALAVCNGGIVSAVYSVEHIFHSPVRALLTSSEDRRHRLFPLLVKSGWQADERFFLYNFSLTACHKYTYYPPRPGGFSIYGAVVYKRVIFLAFLAMRWSCVRIPSRF